MQGGFRVLARKQGERGKIWSRRSADFTDRFSTIAEAVGGLSVGRALIDGEAVVLMDDGRSDFHAVMTKRGGLVAALIAFDLFSSAGIRDVDSGDNSTAGVDAKRAAIQS
jgi:bifunctional non-homologous end joining protein LigD